MLININRKEQHKSYINDSKKSTHPLNTKIFIKNFEIHKPKKRFLTIPCSPNITKKQSKDSIRNKKFISNNINKYNKISSRITPIQKINNDNDVSLTKTSIPFHFPDEILRKKITEFKEKIQKERENSEHLHHYVANSIPCKNVNIKAVKHIIMPTPLVKPMPFNLITEQRGNKYQENFTNRMKKMKEEEDKLRIFVAKPPLILSKIPFTISKSKKPLTEFKNIKLETEIRAKKWVKFEKQLKEKENYILKLKKEQEKYKKLSEKKWIKEQRRKTIIRANPLPLHIYRSKKL